MTRTTLVLVHGRSQQGRDPEELKKTWLDTLRLGLGTARSGVLETVDIVLPYYGDMLDQLASQTQDSIPADIRVRDSIDGVDAGYRSFEAEVVAGVQGRLGLTDGQVDLFVTNEVRVRGIENWEWVQSVLGAADSIPGISAAAIEAFTRDVYVYLNRPAVRQAVNDVVDAALPAGRTVVIGHSLGSVVAYDVLRNATRPLDIPLYVTVGSPLGVGPIRRALTPIHTPAALRGWFNAFDERDVIALSALDATAFPVVPPIENYNQVHNRTENAHGITGYLNDPVVAGRIHDALL
jgi:hypothetical protein